MGNGNLRQRKVEFCVNTVKLEGKYWSKSVRFLYPLTLPLARTERMKLYQHADTNYILVLAGPVTDVGFINDPEKWYVLFVRRHNDSSHNSYLFERT